MEGNEEVENYHSEETPFQVGSINIGPVMVKREFVSMEREGIVEEPYQEIDFSQANFDDINIIPDEDPLSCDQLNRHRHVVDRRKKADKVVSTFNVIMGLPPESGEVQALKNPFKRGRKKRKVGSSNELVDEIDEIEAIINENESTLENEESEKKVKLELELVGTPANPNTKTDQDSITSKTLRVSRRTWLCTICNVGFPNEQFYILHVKAKHADKFPHACRHCGKRFAKFDEKKKHETIHDPNRFKGEPKFACDFCDKKYHIKVSLEGHRKVAHLGYIKPKRKRLSVPVTQHHARGIRRPEPEVKVEKVLYPCTECDLKFDFRFKLKRHMRVHTGETPFSCEICHQPFKFVSGLRHHIKVVHENPTNNPRRSRPKFMANQPCPCEICGRVFKVPSHLTKHMTLHTGEKNYECNICGKHFRISQDLKLHQRRHTLKESNRKPFKCRYCGNRYIMFNELNNHRIGKHRDIPYPDNRDMEKSFGCGICGKPYHLEEQAMVCAILGHDPTTLREAMFKHKCPECPEDRFGYHNLIRLRKHWQDEHPHNTLPVNFRKGLYQNVKDSLPSVTLDKQKVKELRSNGTSVKYEFPLVVEFDLLEVQEEFRGEANARRRKKSMTPKVYDCTFCGMILSGNFNLKRHVRLVHTNPKPSSSIVCAICSQRFRKMKTFRQHEKIHHKSAKSMRIPVTLKRTAGLSIKKEPDLNPKSLSTSDHINETPTTPQFDRWESPATVNVNDETLVKVVLGGKTLKIILTRLPVEDATNVLPESEEDSSQEISQRVNIHDVASIKLILGNKELRVLL